MRDVTLIANDLTKVYGTSTPLTARLLDNGTPLANKSLVFKIHGVEYVRTTNSNGQTSLNIKLLAGTYPCTIRFLGDSTYNSASIEVVVRVVSDAIPQQSTKNSQNYFEVNKIPLHVIMTNGFDVKTGQNIKETPLLYDDDHYNSPTFYFNSGFDGDEFECSVLIKESYFFNGQQVMAYLNAYNKMNTVVSVVTDAMIVANGKYTMQIKDKKQTTKEYSIWKLRFKQYYENNLSFESIYEEKTSTFSSMEQLLIQQKQGINSKSSSDVILALQRLLDNVGCFVKVKQRIDEYGYPRETIIVNGSDFMKREPDGVWDGQMKYDIFDFQGLASLDLSKQGVCDYETITALILYNQNHTQFEYQGVVI